MAAHKKTLALLAVCLLWLADLGARPISTFPDLQISRSTRIVSLVPAVTEMLFAIGAGPRVVGVSSYDSFPAEVKKLPNVGALIDPNIERILSLKPDLVVVYASQDDLKRQLSRAGIGVFDYRHAGLADITSTIRAVGERTGDAAGANALAGSLERGIEGVRTRVKDRPRPRTLLVFGRERLAMRGIYASGGIGFLHDMLAVAGGIGRASCRERVSECV